MVTGESSLLSCFSPALSCSCTFCNKEQVPDVSCYWLATFCGFMKQRHTVHSRAASLTASQAACSSRPYLSVMLMPLDACALCEVLNLVLSDAVLGCESDGVSESDRKGRAVRSGAKYAHKGRHKRPGNWLVCSTAALMPYATIWLWNQTPQELLGIACQSQAKRGFRSCKCC